MAGIFDRLQPTGLIGLPGGDPDGENPERITVTQFHDGLAGVVLGLFSQQAYFNGLNTLLAGNGSQPLRPEDETDLTNIVNEAVGQPNNTQKLFYLHKAQVMGTGTELGLTSEVNFRNNLNIP